MGRDNLTHKMDFFFADIFFGGIVKSTHLGVVAARTFFNRGTRGEKPFPRTSHRVFGTLKAATNFWNLGFYTKFNDPVRNFSLPQHLPPPPLPIKKSLGGALFFRGEDPSSSTQPPPPHGFVPLQAKKQLFFRVPHKGSVTGGKVIWFR